MDDNGPSRPLGWWLKEADACIDAAFESALAATGLDRRRWQLLASLAQGPRSRSGLAAALRRFDDVATVDAIVDDLAAGGLVVAQGSGMVELTADGRAVHADAAELVGGVRARVAESLGRDGYERLVELLAQLVHGLADAPPPTAPVADHGRPT